MKKNVLIALIAALCMPLSMNAQHSVSGRITDQLTNESLPGAHIIVQGSFLTAISDDNGHYEMSKLKKGSYKLLISYMGYESIERELELSKDMIVNISLEPTAILQDEVVIRGIRTFRTQPPSFSNITDKQVSERNLGRDLPYVLALTPSTVVSSDAGNGVGYTAIRIRGTDITGINVTLNGIPLNDPESHGVWWVNMPDMASSANKLQIQRGVGTSTNGAAAFGASINIQTQEYNVAPYGELNSSFGSYNTFKNTLRFGSGLIKGRWSIDGRTSCISSDGYIDRASSSLKSIFLSAAYNGEKSIYRFNIISGKEKTYQAWMGVPKDSLETRRTYNPYTYENETDNYQQDHYQFFYTRELNRSWLLNAALFYVRGSGYYEQFKEDRGFASYGLEDIITGGDTISATDLVQQKWLDNHFYGLTWSAHYKQKKIDLIIGGGGNKYIGDHFGKIIWAQYAANMEKDHRWYFNDGIKTDLNLYAKANYQATEKINLYGDMQYRIINYRIHGIHDDLRNISQEHDFNFFNPKLGMVYTVSDRQEAYFTFGMANREPNRSAYRDALPGEEPTYETLYDYELGYKYTASRLTASANIFYMDYSNQLVHTGKINNVGTPIMTNVKDSYRTGIELQANIRLAKRLHWSLNASFSRNKIKDFIAYVDNWNYWDDPDNEPLQYADTLGETDISFSPAIVAGSLLDYEPLKDLHISLASNYVGKQYVDNTSSDERSLDPWFLNDIRFMYTIRTELVKEISIHLQVNNIFSVEYESNAWIYRYIYNGQEGVMDGYFPQAPTNFFVGLGIKL